MAVLEVIICSDYPTQIALGATFAGLGFGPEAPGQLNITFVVLVSLADTVLLLALIAMFMSVHKERPRELLLGNRPVGAEARAGVPLALIALVLGVALMNLIREFAPWSQDVAENPLIGLMQSPRDILLFGVVVVIAGGVREEIQRAFLLRRFERWLGGGALGVIITSLSFGAGHLQQGRDPALPTAISGAMWGVVYLRRRSVVAPVVSHSGFNLLQLGQYLTFGR
jgi:membrane protease YdiL (CAAX protease family)